jgi:hypothetical protein
VPTQSSPPPPHVRLDSHTFFLSPFRTDGPSTYNARRVLLHVFVLIL